MSYLDMVSTPRGSGWIGLTASTSSVFERQSHPLPRVVLTRSSQPCVIVSDPSLSLIWTRSVPPAVAGGLASRPQPVQYLSGNPTRGSGWIGLTASTSSVFERQSHPLPRVVLTRSSQPCVIVSDPSLSLIWTRSVPPAVAGGLASRHQPDQYLSGNPPRYSGWY